MSTPSSLLGEFENASAILAAIRRGDVSSREVVESAIQRIEAVNSRINAVVVERFEAARREADEADRVPREQRGILHGLPVTIKEMFDVKGMPTTAGIARRKTLRVSHDAVAVDRWRRAGAIVLGKTNVPQLGMLIESVNPVYGRTKNPWRLDRSPGGSSGGEAAILAARASLLGLGSDGAGSIRMPAHFCGIYGFKPTGGRITMRGHWLSKNWPDDWAQPGPMAHSVADLVLGTQAMLPDAMCEIGESPVPLDIDGLSNIRGLRVGMYEQLDALPVAPTVRRAVRRAADCLENLGCQVVPFRPPSTNRIWDTYLSIFYAEGLRDMKRQMAGSRIEDGIRQAFRMASVPRHVRAWVARIAKRTGQLRFGHLLENIARPVVSAQTYCDLLAAMHGYRGHFLARLRRERLDAILAPVAPIPAVLHGEFYANFAMMYTGIYNLLAMPAGVVPVTRVRSDEIPAETVSRDVVDQSLERVNQGSTGLPVGVQIVAERWQDVRVLALMRALESEIAFSQRPALTADREA